jgi:hypothetical protein
MATQAEDGLAEASALMTMVMTKTRARMPATGA